MNSKPLFVITGGPSSGKTTLINELAKQGYDITPEAGRAVIQEQLTVAGEALPWVNPLAFAEQMLVKDLAAYDKVSQQSAAVIFDRGIPDICGYLMTIKQTIPVHIWQAAQSHLYHRYVFIAPFWPEIFEQDRERKQSLAEAKLTYETMREVYIELGYSLIQLPKVSVVERVDFIKHYLG